MNWRVPGKEADQRKHGKDCAKRLSGTLIEHGGYHGL